ncbi:DUF72 domain-containing protein [Pedobacter sp. L105]|uniref:DUF72 domain-containing protein n=1 Tax=Pedobacter sp. L105 TaxID=1641871 RepID=UPI00131D9945|nr:DUF72 domain-containing protein [Pedobacter sp. L105]
MEFGKIPSEEVQSVNFILPKDGLQTVKVLNGKESGAKAAISVGCAKWGLPEWVGFLYPPKTKPADFLEEYAKHFNSIELNAAYYKIPTVETARKWKKQVTASAKNGFLFCPKFPESVSHYKRLKGAERATDDFLTSVIEFEGNLGPCFLQMSDSFGPNNLPELRAFLKSLPQDLNVFVELRNEEWFSDPAIRKGVFQLFSQLNKGAVITDVSGRRDVLHMEVTIDEVFIRFIGNGAAHRESDFARIDEWADRLFSWQERGLKKIYFFVHQTDERESVRLAIHAVESFNKTLGSQIPEIRLQPSLFI